MFCSKCGADLAGSHGAKFCPSCGKPLLQKPNASKQIIETWIKSASASADAAIGSVARSVASLRGRLASLDKRKFAIVSASSIVAAILLVGGATFAVGEYQISDKDDVSLQMVIDDQTSRDLAAAACAPMKSELIEPEDMPLHEEHLALLRQVSASSNLRGILNYQNNNYWTSDTLPDLTESLDAQVKDLLSPELRGNSRIMKDSFDAVLTKVSPEFRQLILDNCGIRTEYENQVGFSVSYNLAQAAFAAKADSAPWYPAGYYETPDGLLAWKWVSKYKDCYSCRYSHVSVIAKEGCYGGVYAETNFLNNGVVIDWTNDSIPALSAGQKAVLSFVSYDDNANKTQAPTFTCHKN